MPVVCAMLAHVLVKIHPGKECAVACEVGKIKEITEAAWTYGFCDILLKTEVESIEKLDRIMFKNLRKTPGVISTETIIVSPIPIYASRPPSKTRTRRTRAKRRRA